MVINTFKKLWPAVLILTGVLGLIALPREIKAAPEAFADWVKLLPFGREALPQILFLGLTSWGCWRLFKDDVLPLFAHKVGPWKYDLISMHDLMRLAGERHGWAFTNTSLQILDLIDGIGQACGEGRIQAHGRFNPLNFSDPNRIYLLPIRPSYWRGNFIDALGAYHLGNNREAVSRSLENMKTREYVDLHFNRIQARAWLIQEGMKWKGRRDGTNQENSAASGPRLRAVS